MDLRLLGLGLLVTADFWVPLLSFAYPGNVSDLTSFGSFSRRLKVRKKALPIGAETTVVCDGGNISKERVDQLEKEQPPHIVRLPYGHAQEVDTLHTKELPIVAGDFEDEVRAKKLETLVYGKPRKAPQPAAHIRAAFRRSARKRDRRQACVSLPAASLSGACAHRLGRTVILTAHKGWEGAQILSMLREQNHVEQDVWQLKDPEWARAVPLRHQKDPMLRVHTFIWRGLCTATTQRPN